MKVIRKDSNVCSFEDLDSGDVFKFSETGSLFMKIVNPAKEFLNCLNIEVGKLSVINSNEVVIPVDGYFVEGMVENDA